MAEAVIYDLEPVEIQKDHGELKIARAIGTLDRDPQTVCEMRSIWQARQRIMKSCVMH
jgi:hypothetical protein